MSHGKRTTINFGITLNKEVYAAVEANRRQLSRSGYINDVLYRALMMDTNLKGLTNFPHK